MISGELIDRKIENILNAHNMEPFNHCVLSIVDFDELSALNSFKLLFSYSYRTFFFFNKIQVPSKLLLQPMGYINMRNM